METNREKFNKITTSINTELLKEVDYRSSNRDWLRRSSRIAAKVLMALKEQKMTQKDLAEKMNVSPQYINKLVKGGENLTTETITKLENILDIAIFADSIRVRNTNVSSAYSGTFNGTHYVSATYEFYNDAI
ncbi:MAG: helix-turn-helix transcriptional regulator [Proteiniphilum sp.]